VRPGADTRAHVVELLDEDGVEAGLLLHLAPGGLGGRLAGIDQPLGESQHLTAPEADAGHPRATAEAPDDDPPGGELAHGGRGRGRTLGHAAPL
jgi:hypothetical protein